MIQQTTKEGRIKCTLIPGDGVGPEMVYSVQEVFKVIFKFILHCLFYFFQLHAVSFTLQGRKRKPIVKIQHSPFSAELWRYCIWRNSKPRFASIPERRNENIYLISPSGDPSHRQSCLQSHTCAPAPRLALFS